MTYKTSSKMAYREISAKTWKAKDVRSMEELKPAETQVIADWD